MNFDKDESTCLYFIYHFFLIVQKINRILVLSKLSFTIKRWFYKVPFNFISKINYRGLMIFNKFNIFILILRYIEKYNYFIYIYILLNNK